MNIQWCSKVAQALASGGLEAGEALGEALGAGVIQVINAKIHALSDIYDHLTQTLSAFYQVYV